VNAVVLILKTKYSLGGGFDSDSMSFKHISEKEKADEQEMTQFKRGGGVLLETTVILEPIGGIMVVYYLTPNKMSHDLVRIVENGPVTGNFRE
jgi:hypothetical protein